MEQSNNVIVNNTVLFYLQSALYKILIFIWSRYSQKH